MLLASSLLVLKYNPYSPSGLLGPNQLKLNLVKLNGPTHWHYTEEYGYYLRPFSFLLFKPNSTTTNGKPSSTTTNSKPRNPQPQPQPPPPIALNTTTTSTKKSEWIKNPNPPTALNQMCLMEKKRGALGPIHQRSLISGLGLVRFANEASDLYEASSLTIRPGLNPIRRQSLISGLGSVRFAGEAWSLGWREMLLDGTKSKPNTSNHGLGVSRLSLWWWRWN